MRFMMLMIPRGYQSAEPSAQPTPEMIATMMKYNEDLSKSGVLLGLDGLYPPSTAVRLRFATDKRPTITDGPFTETKEAVGGYWIIQVKSKEEAVEWASRCPAWDGDVIEVRQIQDPSDFPAEGAAEVSAALRATGRSS